jgi:hypothetical protein
MHKLIEELRVEFSNLRFVSGKQFYWSPESNEVFYNSAARGQQARWSLLHETGHALLGHTSYKADYELVRLEVAAWDQAKQLAKQFQLTINENHIQDCLDTYRDWLYKRSLCPNCGTQSLQEEDFIHYRCFNCHTIWRVTTNRFCRAYRRQKNIEQTTLLHVIG